MLNVGIVGAGYWGKNYLRKFSELDGSRVLWCSDLDVKCLEKVRQQYPSIRLSVNYQDILRDPAIDVVCIATPASTHYAICKDALESNKHVLIEKPLALTSGEGEKLVRLSEKKETVLMVDHTFLYNAAIRKLKEYVSNGNLGDIRYFSFVRTSFGPIRSDVNALWDLAPHDISMLQFLHVFKPSSIYAIGQSYLKKSVEDVVFVTVRYPDKVIANIQVSWLQPGKTRKVFVVGSEKTAVFDDLEESQKLKIIANNGETVVPSIDHSEPLKNVCACFLECVSNNSKPLADGKNGLEVVKILENAQRSLELGNEVRFSP